MNSFVSFFSVKAHKAKITGIERQRLTIQALSATSCLKSRFCVACKSLFKPIRFITLVKITPAMMMTAAVFKTRINFFLVFITAKGLGLVN